MIKNNKIPKQLDEAFDNMNDLLSKLTPKGLYSYFEDKEDAMNKTRFTSFGVEVNVKDKKDTPYKIIVTPSHLTDDDEMRKLILYMAESIKENFPELLNQQSIQ